MLIPNLKALSHHRPAHTSQLEAALSLVEASQAVIVDQCVSLWTWEWSPALASLSFFLPQLSDQPSLEEAIRIASRIQQGESPGLDEWWTEHGQRISISIGLSLWESGSLPSWVVLFVPYHPHQRLAFMCIYEFLENNAMLFCPSAKMKLGGTS